MRRGLATALTLALAWLTAGCGAPSTPAHPALWVVRDADTTVYLFGTVHRLPRELDWQGGPVGDALAESNGLVLELAPAEMARAPALFMTMAGDEAVAPLGRRIGAAQADTARRLARNAGLDRADRVESWALAVAIAAASAETAEMTPDAGVEAVLGARFAADQIVGLERADAQLALFDDLPDGMQTAMLRHALTDRANAPERLRAMVQAWAAGDLAALDRVAQQDLAAMPGLAEPLLHARNRGWAAWVAERMAQPGRLFLAVGAGHMVGETGLPTLLAARGLSVERLQ